MLGRQHVDRYLLVAMYKQVSITPVELCQACVAESFALLSTDNYACKHSLIVDAILGLLHTEEAHRVCSFCGLSSDK